MICLTFSFTQLIHNIALSLSCFVSQFTLTLSVISVQIYTICLIANILLTKKQNLSFYFNSTGKMYLLSG